MDRIRGCWHSMRARISDWSRLMWLRHRRGRLSLLQQQCDYDAKAADADPLDTISFSCIQSEDSAVPVLDVATMQRRQRILQVLVHNAILTQAEANVIDQSPKPSPFPSQLTCDNYFWMPGHLQLCSCFVDYLNYRCTDHKMLASFLFRLSDCEAVLYQGKAVFYSFCLGREVATTDVQHCPRCHRCFDQTFWHCLGCNRCTTGIAWGRICKRCLDVRLMKRAISKSSFSCFEDMFSTTSVSVPSSSGSGF